MEQQRVLKSIFTIIVISGFMSALSMRVQGSRGSPSEQWRELVRSKRMQFPLRLCNYWRHLSPAQQTAPDWNLGNECAKENERRSWLYATSMNPDKIPRTFKQDPMERLAALSQKWQKDLEQKEWTWEDLKDLEVGRQMAMLIQEHLDATELSQKLNSLGYERLDRLILTLTCEQDSAGWKELRPLFESLPWEEARQVMTLAKQKKCVL